MPKTVKVSECKRGYLASLSSDGHWGTDGSLFAFDQIIDLAKWMVGEFGGANLADTVELDPEAATADLLKLPNDVRSGVTYTQHAVLDRVQQLEDAREVPALDLNKLAQLFVGGIMVISARPRSQHNELVEFAARLIYIAEHCQAEIDANG